MLSIGGYVDLLQFALDRQLVVKSNLCYSPGFMRIELLPADVKQLYRERYLKFVDSIGIEGNGGDYNASDPTNYKSIIKEEAEYCIKLLNSSTPANSDQELKNLVDHCKKWDAVYKFDARELYPELMDVWNKYGY